MHEALILIARTIALADDHRRRAIGRRMSMSGQVAVLEERLQRLRVENALLRARWHRLPGKRRPHHRRHERLEILWHAARHRLSINDAARAFRVTRQTIMNWRRALPRGDPPPLPRMGTISDVVAELVVRLKAEWPAWGTRRIAGKLARVSVRVSRSSVQRILRRPRAPKRSDRVLSRTVAGLLAKHPNHIWMIDFTHLGGVVKPTFVSAVIDAYSRKVLATGFHPGRPNAVRDMAAPAHH